MGAFTFFGVIFLGVAVFLTIFFAAAFLVAAFRLDGVGAFDFAVFFTTGFFAVVFLATAFFLATGLVFIDFGLDVFFETDLVTALDLVDGALDLVLLGLVLTTGLFGALAGAFFIFARWLFAAAFEDAVCFFFDVVDFAAAMVLPYCLRRSLRLVALFRVNCLLCNCHTIPWRWNCALPCAEQIIFDFTLPTQYAS